MSNNLIIALHIHFIFKVYLFKGKSENFNFNTQCQTEFVHHQRYPTQALKMHG